MQIEKITRVLGYVRVSTEEQATEGYSLDNQRADIKDYCKRNKWELVDILSDEGVSGATLNQREGMQRLLRQVSKEDIDYVIVWKISRLSRRLSDVVKIVEILDNKKTYLYSIKDNIDTNSQMGKSFLYIGSIFAEIERENLIVQVRGGMREKAKQGRWVGGKPPIGYELVDEYLVVNQEKANVVKLIFKDYLSGAGYTEIADRLNQQGYKTREDKAFSNTSVKGILRNPIYAGKIRWNNL